MVAMQTDMGGIFSCFLKMSCLMYKVHNMGGECLAVRNC